jgi:membrane-associated phospholipid phosphatase
MNKDRKISEIIRLPELEINEACKRILNKVSHIRRIYWILSISIILVLFLAFLPDYMWDYFWSRLKGQKVLVSMLLIFSAIAFSLVWKTGQRIDVWVFMVFNMNGRRTPCFDWIMLALTQLGNGVFAMAVAAVLFLTINHVLAYELILGTLTLWLAVSLIKAVIHRTRPYIKLKNIHIVGPRASGHSFPSGHTSQSFYMATLLGHYFNMGLGIYVPLYACAALVGFTRMYVGVHYPRDVLAGACLGTAWGLIGSLMYAQICA